MNRNSNSNDNAEIPAIPYDPAFNPSDGFTVDRGRSPFADDIGNATPRGTWATPLANEPDIEANLRDEAAASGSLGLGPNDPEAWAPFTSGPGIAPTPEDGMLLQPDMLGSLPTPAPTTIPTVNPGVATGDAYTQAIAAEQAGVGSEPSIVAPVVDGGPGAGAAPVFGEVQGEPDAGRGW